MLILAQVNGNVVAGHFLGVTADGSVLLVKKAGDIVLDILKTHPHFVLGLPLQIAD